MDSPHARPGFLSILDALFPPSPLVPTDVLPVSLTPAPGGNGNPRPSSHLPVLPTRS